MKHLPFLLLIALAMGACMKTYAIPCPSLTEYSVADQRRLAVELKKLTPETRAVVMPYITDYHKTRNAIRACQKRQAR